MNCYPSSRQTKNIKFSASWIYIPAGIFMRPAIITDTSPVVSRLPGFAARVYCCSIRWNAKS